MADVSAWIKGNWFNAVQTVGVIGSLLFTAKTIADDTKARKISNILAISQRHREIWQDAHQRKALKRVFWDQVDLVAYPATVAETEFLRGIAADFEDGWEIARLTNPKKLKLLALDTGEFFSHPLPRLVWEKTKKFRSPEFAKFVERALERSGHLSAAGT